MRDPDAASVTGSRRLLSYYLVRSLTNRGDRVLPKKNPCGTSQDCLAASFSHICSDPESAGLKS
jgi:hypothetical protein